jgi:zinc protease
MLDRKNPPVFQTIEELHLPALSTQYLSNSSPVYSVHSDSLKVFRLDIVIRSGYLFSKHITDASLAASILGTASSRFNSEQITKTLELMGCSAEYICGLEFFTLRLYGLSSSFKDAVPYFFEIITDFVAKEEELTLVKSRLIQQIKINQNKADLICNDTFRNRYFEAGEKIGHIITETDVLKTELKACADFINEKVQHSQFSIYLAGFLPTKYYEILDQSFGKKTITENKTSLSINTFSQPFSEKIVKEEFVQASIKLGTIGLHKSHKDASAYMVTNVLFGGYFGSRLMKNIREEKGLTYGIHSANIPYLYHNIWTISSSVIWF